MTSFTPRFLYLLILGCTSGVFLLYHASRPLNLKDDSKSTKSASSSPNETSGNRHSAKLATRADKLHEGAKHISSRIGNIKSEINQASDPARVFRELAELIGSIKSPTQRFAITNEILQSLTSCEDPIQLYKWLKHHEQSIDSHFKGLSSGMGPSVYDSICISVARSAIANEKTVELAAILRNTSDDKNTQGIAPSILAYLTEFSGRFDLLDGAPSEEFKNNTLGNILSIRDNSFGVYNPDTRREVISDYLSKNFESFTDNGNQLIGKFVTTKWYAEHLDEIEPLLSSAHPGPNRDRFLMIVASRAAESGNGEYMAYLDQIQSDDFRDQANKQITAIKASIEATADP